MAIFKIERCPKCTYKHNEPKPRKENKPCPKCGTQMKYITNWYISYQTLGRKYVEAVGPQKRFAEDALAKRRTQIRENKFFEVKAQTTWKEAVSTLRKTYNSLSKDSVRMYENSLKILENHGLSKHTFSKLTIETVNDYISDRQTDSVTNSTINRELATLKRMAHICKHYELFNAIKLLHENAPRKRFLSEQEKEALKHAIAESTSPYLQLAVLISLDTGLRKRTVLSLRWDDINFTTGLITKKTKGGKEAKVPLTERLKELLLNLKETLTQQKIISMYLFYNQTTGTYVKELKTAFNTALQKAGIKDCRWHDLRKTFGSHFVMATRDLVALQQLLGHSDYNTTRKHYAHLASDYLKNAINIYEGNTSERNSINAK